jgi:hypothetical protein
MTVAVTRERRDDPAERANIQGKRHAPPEPRGRVMSGPQARTTERFRDDDIDDEPDDDDLVDIALLLAAQGLAVFPCAASKRPASPSTKAVAAASMPPPILTWCARCLPTLRTPR